MEISNPLEFKDRSAWRAWLGRHHREAPHAWVLLKPPRTTSGLIYLDAVEEALCFGWIDSTAKRFAPGTLAQRFSPRRPRSRWTELNKARARRMLSLGQMTESGAVLLPNLAMQTEVAPDIEAALRATPAGWSHWQAMPALYRAVRLSYVEEVRRSPEEFRRRLGNLIAKTADNIQFGNWTDGGRLTELDPESADAL